MTFVYGRQTFKSVTGFGIGMHGDTSKDRQKWQKIYIGPFLATRVIEPVSYVIQRSARAKPLVVHVDKLKKCIGDTPISWLRISSTDDDPTTTTPTIEKDTSPAAVITIDKASATERARSGVDAAPPTLLKNSTKRGTTDDNHKQ